ncbi:DUF3072 domain-containing protein [Salinicola halophilus]|uniref:DUF3072 domain-containing protein n=1 Tax=Salinicola halophilus TaxID=184065 RepID=UPI000DA11FE6|nr:DUF3072 domain-containing protein [Salinicola halophilus]
MSDSRDDNAQQPVDDQQPIDDQQSADDQQPSNVEKDPQEWVTGEQSMTGAQHSYLKTLCEEAGVAFDENLTKAQASQQIDELQHKTGRGEDH